MNDEDLPQRAAASPVAVTWPRRRSRVLAWVTLALLALVAAAVVALLILSEGLLVLVVAGLSVAVVTAAAAGWWAFTTRRRWKRRLNLALVAVLALGVVVTVAFFSVRFAGGVIGLAVLTVAYAEAARRTLRAATAGAAAPAAPPDRPWLLVNPNSGGGKAAKVGLVDAARERGVEVHALTPGDNVEALVSAAADAGADAVGVAGGDGSLGTVAAVAMRRRLPFFCVPTGTRNHFAADLGLDRTRPLAALDALDGLERRIDVGTVNGRVFLNNVSLGAYADLVHEQRYRDNKLGTARAVLPEMVRTEEPPLGVSVRLPSGEVCADALVVLVANNPYGPQPMERMARRSLDTGVLQVSVLRARTGAQIGAFIARMGRSRGGDPSSGAEWTTPELTLQAPAGEVRAAVDGEATVLAAPLEFRSWPGALHVLVPPGRRRSRPVELLAPLHWRTMSDVWKVALAR